MEKDFWFRCCSLMSKCALRILGIYVKENYKHTCCFHHKFGYLIILKNISNNCIVKYFIFRFSI